MRKKCLFFFQSFLLQIIFYFLRFCSPNLSALWIGKLFSVSGNFVPANKILQRNLKIAFPQKSRNFYQNIQKKSWENLGRNFGEMPHLAKFQKETKIFGLQNLQAAKKQNRPIIFISAHFGNWELLPALLSQEGVTFSPVFRVLNNPYLNQFLLKIRKQSLPKETPIFSKGPKDIRKIISHLKSGKHLGMLIDQKMNDGIQLRFFHQPAMTSSATVTLALKTNAIIVSGRMMRTKAQKPILIIDKPIDVLSFIPRKATPPDIKNLSQLFNDKIENWINQRPSLWLWLHRRWDKSYY
ncbi:hypothetical protein FAI40_00245 [Acetobacteraceae bacterium]|nr:hypothetical protein FAI40_00245 [Acetobacteraceae bacterium]